jgi:signal transduction histidine kinase
MRSSSEGETLLFRADIRYEPDVVLVRQRARQLAGLLGFDNQEQTRLATAVSEIARNAFEYAGGGRAAFLLTTEKHPQLQIRISDDGLGIVNLDSILEGWYVSPSGMGVGILGAKRLVDYFDIRTGPTGGTTVTLGKAIPATTLPLTAGRISDVTRSLLASTPRDPLSELQSQNHELLRALDEIRARQAEVERLNSELEETNRGVLALYAELDDRALQLGRASELKSNFLSNISHELRTPLNAIHNLTNILLQRLDGGLTAEQERQVTMVRSAATSLSEMVNDLLDLARIEAGKTVVRVGEFSVVELLGTLRGMLRPLIAGETVSLIIDPPAVEVFMNSDDGKVAQILRNLVSNSIKFTEGGEIRVMTQYVTEGDLVEFSVTDTGIGIAPGDLERIFEDFSQIEHSLQRKTLGSGLGLPLSRRLAVLLGGTLTAASEPGRGSTFTLRVPRDFQALTVTDESAVVTGDSLARPKDPVPHV